MLPRTIPRFTRAIPLSRRLLSTSPRHHSIALQITGHGSGTKQHVTIEGKPYSFTADTYTTLGGEDSAPSPVSYSLASLTSCNQVTGSIVARDHGVKLGRWDVSLEGVLPTAVLVGGEQGNPNWESITLKVRVQTDIKGGNEAAEFKRFVSEVERRCPITQLFKLSGVHYTSEWENEAL
ncbi:OsmC family protein [Plectosphaerella cucumerina]|uniref:OsmC family protein n=1 Tax=Plectosphaerella cucumerina TaxID=40658 RepID=A0A8K0TD73_9PEZI|nr:OsmC family protein [Plectosphaerella cucumerina]